MSSPRMPRFHRMTLCMLVSAGSFLLLVRLRRDEPRTIVFVHAAPSMDELSKLMQQQRQQLNYVSNQSQVIHRCSGDEPSITYPRLASDDLTEILMGTHDECGHLLSTDAVIIVHSSAANFDRRKRLRNAYGNYNVTKPYRLKVVFLVGSVTDAKLTIQLEQENREHGDTVVGVFLDSYHNLTLKAVMGFRWLTETCPHVKLLIKMDDDVFLDVHKFFTTYWNKIPKTSKINSMHCVLWHNAKVFRTGKWKVEKSLFENSSYPFPYCSGFFVVISPDLIKPIYLQGKSIDFFWIDDVFLYGMVPKAIGGVHFYQVGSKERRVAESYQVYKNCIKRAYCPTWAVLTSSLHEFHSEFDKLLLKR